MPTSARGQSAGTREKSTSSRDAIAQLKADHRQVEDWFEEFGKSRSAEKRALLAQQICMALTAHATIEEEIFYPAFLEATGETDLHHEAEVEHEGAKHLIAQIEQSAPKDEYFEAKVTVLSEMIKHHVKEEEQADGLFAKAKKSGLDLAALGEQMEERRQELLAARQKKAPGKRRAA